MVSAVDGTKTEVKHKHLSEQTLESSLVVVTGVVWLASGLVHDIVLEEVDGSSGQVVVQTVQPDSLVGGTVQVSATSNQNTVVVSPLQLSDRSTVVVDSSTVEDVDVVRLVDNEAGTNQPVPDGLSNVEVALITGVSTKSSSESEQTDVRNSVLVVVTVVPWVDLPSQTTVTVRVVPTVPHGLEGVLCHSQVGSSTVNLWETTLDGLHQSHSPDTLVIVTLNHGLVLWHEVPLWTSLVDDSVLNQWDEGVVVTQVPVLQHGTKGFTCFPPVVW